MFLHPEPEPECDILYSLSFVFCVEINNYSATHPIRLRVS
jgi:hypothetical protein